MQFSYCEFVFLSLHFWVVLKSSCLHIWQIYSWKHLHLKNLPVSGQLYLTQKLDSKNKPEYKTNLDARTI